MHAISDAILHFDAFACLSAAASAALFAAIWQGTLLVSAVALCLRLVPGLSAAARSAIWLNVFALLVALHLIPVFAAASPTPAASSIHLDLRWSVGIACAWAVLSLWRAIQLISSAVSLRRIARRATPIAAGPGLRELLEGQGRFARRARLCASTDVERPGVFGFFRPRILLPPVLLETLTPDELRQVVLHETGHLRRGDDWANLLQKLALVLFPLNPALFWVERRLCAERELACDDRVLRQSPGRKSYALCLTRLAEFSMLQRGVSLVLGAFDRRPELVRRVRRILARPARSMPARAALCASAGLVTVALAFTLMLSRSPQFVSFAPAVPAFDAHAQLSGFAAPQLVKALVARPLVPADTRSDAPPLVRSHIRSAAAPHPAVFRNSRPALPALVPTTAEIATRDLPPEEALPVRQEFVVLTEWTDSDAPSQLVIAVARTSRSHYAAIATANGWLIVQI